MKEFSLFIIEQSTLNGRWGWWVPLSSSLHYAKRISSKSFL